MGRNGKVASGESLLEPTGVLTSTANPRIVAARKLRRRSGRKAAGRFLIDGPGLLDEALDSGISVIEVFATRSATPSLDRARAAGVVITEVSDHVAKALSDTVAPQGVVSVGRFPDVDIAEVLRSDLVVVLDQVRDPGNAGTLVRSALAAGAGAVIFTKGSVDPYGPKTVRSSAGAIFHVPVVSEITLEEAAARLKESGSLMLGTDAGAETTAYDLDLTGPVAVVVGNESWGIPAWEGLDQIVSIPMPGPAESLNVAVAGSLLLFEIVRQRRVSSSKS